MIEMEESVDRQRRSQQGEGGKREQAQASEVQAQSNLHLASAEQMRAARGTLTEPGGITVGPHGDLYVTNNARSPDDGQVLRIDR